MSDDVEVEGGSGGGPEKPKGTTRSTRLLKLALEQAWPIPAGVREEVVERLAVIVRSKTAQTREVVSAAKALVAASQVNLGVVQTALKAEEQEDLRGRVVELEKRLGEPGGDP